MSTPTENACVSDPIARSPIPAAPPVEVRDGWEVSARRSPAPLVLRDATPLAKITIRAPEAGATAAALGVGFGRSRRDAHGLLVGSGPGEWLAIGAVGTADAAVRRLGELAADDEHVSIVDQTHGRALVRLTGTGARGLLTRVCAIDLSDRATPDGAALRTSVANLVVDIIRDDRDTSPSYLLHCERSSGQYLFDLIVDVGAEFDLDVAGFENRP